MTDDSQVGASSPSLRPQLKSRYKYRQALVGASSKRHLSGGMGGMGRRCGISTSRRAVVQPLKHSRTPPPPRAGLLCPIMV
jgi:hypothetical protein